jgi:hypothetical protein
VWATYFNGIIQGSSQAAAAPATSTVAVVAAPAAQASGPSLWQNIKNGFGSVANIFKNPSQYTIHPQSN